MTLSRYPATCQPVSSVDLVAIRHVAVNCALQAATRMILKTESPEIHKSPGTVLKDKVELCKNGQTWQAVTNRGECKNMADPNGEILTLDDVAAFLKAGKRTVYRLAQNGDIPAFKLGGTWRFRRSELNSWIDIQSNQRKPTGKAPR